MSKKLVPAEWISIRYLSAAGVGVGIVEIWRSKGPYPYIIDVSCFFSS